jgi:hypothetical protein
MDVPITHGPLGPKVERSAAAYVVDGVRVVGLLLVIAAWLVAAAIHDAVGALIRVFRSESDGRSEGSAGSERPTPALAQLGPSKVGRRPDVAAVEDRDPGVDGR